MRAIYAAHFSAGRRCKQCSRENYNAFPRRTSRPRAVASRVERQFRVIEFSVAREVEKSAAEKERGSLLSARPIVRSWLNFVRLNVRTNEMTSFLIVHFSSDPTRTETSFQRLSRGICSSFLTGQWNIHVRDVILYSLERSRLLESRDGSIVSRRRFHPPPPDTP